MATFLDVTGLQYFTNFFVFIFVWLAVYAILSFGNILGKNTFVHVISGLVIALLVLISPVATGLIAFIAPWFALVFVFIILIAICMKSFGASAAEIASYSSLKAVFFIIVLIVLIVGSLAYVRENANLPEGEEIDYSKSVSIIFHPKVLGAVFILMTAVFAIALLAGKQT